MPIKWDSDAGLQFNILVGHLQVCKLLTVGSALRAWQRGTVGINNRGVGISVEAPVGLQEMAIKGEMRWLCGVNTHSDFCAALLSVPIQPNLCLLLCRLLLADQLIWDLTESYLWIVLEYHVESEDP